jgi:hypothetical protein
MAKLELRRSIGIMKCVGFITGFMLGSDDVTGPHRVSSFENRKR